MLEPGFFQILKKPVKREFLTVIVEDDIYNKVSLNAPFIKDEISKTKPVSHVLAK